MWEEEVNENELDEEVENVEPSDDDLDEELAIDDADFDDDMDVELPHEDLE